MNAHRVNITLPQALFLKLKAVPNKSAFIAEALRERLEHEEAGKRQQALADAYREASREERSLTEDWDRIAGDDL